MGAPKQRWTPEEEAALKAGVAKHGPGKWRTILRDPEFSVLLRLRSNVDLKDKWRNLSVTAGGYGSREKARMALKKGRHVPKVTAEPMDIDANDMDSVDNAVIDAKPLAMAVEPLQVGSSSEKSVARLDDLILEAIKKLKEPSGSNKTAIAAYIEEQYWPPADFQRLLSTKLKALVSSGNLMKVNQKYRIAPSSLSLGGKSTKVYSTEEMNGENNVKQLTKLQVDAELEKMKGMTKEEAAAFAAKAVAEAEVAIAEAEEAARVAEAAETDAEAAKAFLDAVTSTMKNRNAAFKMLRAC
ncbi:single myb histone 1-like [Phragmites australis]|uniref:single myb histone 1-like n=1 Tax=Phragmites australis TaxID=29695 RepID=UPI002D77E091|nr:single myb histone 1-like [Phragmites australis]